MARFNYYCVDTNFFITLYSAQPKEFEKLNEILRKIKIKFMITDFVQREMRWYMRRHIEPHVKIFPVDKKKLMKYEADLRKKVGSLPQTPDVSVIYAAEQQGIPIVSSDLKLIETAEKVGIKTFMNSAFAIFLKNKLKEEEDVAFIEEIHTKLFGEEVSYSVKGQHVYDPVVRIKKIMDSALSVVNAQASISEPKVNKDFDYQEYHDLIDLTKEVRTDLSDYLEMMEEGNFEALSQILTSESNQLLDRCTEVRLLGVPETDHAYREAVTTLAHILLLGVVVDLNLQKVTSAQGKVDLLLLLLFEIKDVAERLEIEVHLQRIIIFFLTNQVSRLNVYFTPTFMDLCRKKGRADVIDLLRTFAIISAVLTNQKAEKGATAKDFSEIEFIIQLGYQFISAGFPEKAWLLFEQAIYMSLNSNMTGLLYAIFEVMLPLHYSKEGFKPPLQDIFKFIEGKNKEIQLKPYWNRLKLKEDINPNILIKRHKDVNSLPKSYQGFLDVLNVEPTSFKNLGRANLVKVIDWETQTMIGIIDPTLTLDENLTVGCSVKILSGKVKLIQPPKRLRERTGVSLLIVCGRKDPKFIIRRSGIASLAKPKEKLASYDL